MTTNAKKYLRAPRARSSSRLDGDDAGQRLLAVRDRAAVAVDRHAGLVDAGRVGREEGAGAAPLVHLAEEVAPRVRVVLDAALVVGGPLVRVVRAAAPDVVDALPAAGDPVDGEEHAEEELGELDAALGPPLQFLDDLGEAEEPQELERLDEPGVARDVLGCGPSHGPLENEVEGQAA